MNHSEITGRYITMSNDELLRIAADPDSLTTAAQETLASELRKRGLDDPDAIRKYQQGREEQTKQEDVVAASIFQRIYDDLKQHPLGSLLASIGCPAVAFLIGYVMVELRIGNGRVLSSLVCLTLTFGGLCGVAAARSSARLPIRIAGFLAMLGEFYYAFFFLFAATIGFR